jgi:hypothetical protein
MRPPPLLMVGVYAFGLALVGFSLVLLAPYGPPAWVWSLNAVAIASGLCSAGYWLRQAHRD